MRLLSLLSIYLSWAPSCLQAQEQFFAELFLNGNDLDSGLYEGQVIGRRLFGGLQVPHGKGTIYYFTTDKYKRQNYTGDWLSGTRDGNGTTHWRDGSTYRGEYKQGLEDGKGVLFYPNGDSLVGVFKEGKIHGPGTFRYASGNQRAGTFNQNVLEGEVVFTSVSGEVRVEKWINGKKVDTLEDGKKATAANFEADRPDSDNQIQTEAGSEDDSSLAFPTLWYDETHQIEKVKGGESQQLSKEQSGDTEFPVPDRDENERGLQPSLFSSTPSKAYKFNLASVLEIVKEWDEKRTISN